MPKWQNYSAKSLAKCTNKRQTTQQAILNRKYTLLGTVGRLARSNAFEINKALNMLKGVRLTFYLTGEARKSAIDVARLLIITETVHSSTPSAMGVIVKDTYRLCAGRLVSQSEKEKWLNTWCKNEQRISQLRCSLLPHMSINRRFYYKSRTFT